MCGICGVVVRSGDGRVERPELVALRDAQRHRGPDDEGLWLSDTGRVGFGHRRLSIIDLSPRGRQPMALPDETLRIVFNGEIYNFRALRAELEGLGSVFASDSDTEVILHGYRHWGLGVLDRLRGMFAFALHDAERGDVLLARDPLGIKPLYVAETSDRLWFSSEVQPLRQRAIGSEIDAEGLVTFLLWGSIAPPYTLHRDIRALPPGSWLRVGPGAAPEPTVYYRFEDAFGRPDPMDATEASLRVRAALVDSVRHHLEADVPVGAFLSGGVDSAALVGLLSELHDGPVETVTLSFDVPGLDEGPLAREAASLYGSDHHEIRIGQGDVRDRLPEAIASLDAPSVDGINTFFVSEATVRAGLKVAVSGVGGDELFGGYASFARIPRIRRTHDRLASLPGLAPLLRGIGGGLEHLPRHRVLGKLAKALLFGGDEAGAYYADRGVFSPHEVRALLAPELRAVVDACGPAAWLRRRIPVDALPSEERVGMLEFRQYLQSQLLRDTDATSMRHSLEVRTPFVDRELVRVLARIPAGQRQAGPAKRMLRDAPRPPVPPALWDRPKQGFTLPIDSWLRSGALDLPLPSHPALDPRAVRRVASDFRRGRVHWSRLWSLLVLAHYLA
jgi:asparagine synthase (glutamine-hydrolysing)